MFRAIARVISHIDRVVRRRGDLSHPIARPRHEVLLASIPRSARIVEIGPSHRPIAAKADGWDTVVIDHATRAELVAKYAGHDVDLSRIEEVDYVWTSGPLIDAIPQRLHGSFDALIASHLIEHTTDFVGFLGAAEVLLSGGGTVVLVVPDKRYCFDYFRPVTTTGQVLYAHASRRSRHTRRIIFDEVAYAVNNNSAGAWGQEPVRALEFLYTIERAMEEFSKSSEDPSSPYIDKHAWQFTSASFQLIMFELARLGETDWQIQHISPSTGCEFHVWLCRGGKAEAAALCAEDVSARRLALLKRSLLDARDQIDFLLAGEPNS
jgi:predicted SAM-dependent methyltransferase